MKIVPLLNKDRPRYRHLAGDYYEMFDSLRYLDEETLIVHIVEAGFRWDKGSILKLIPRACVPHGDEMTYPSALHDKFYVDYSVTRATADRILRQFLIEEGLHPFKAWAAWCAVRMNLLAAYRWGKDDA
jgi:hypothetical protein